MGFDIASYAALQTSRAFHSNRKLVRVITGPKEKSQEIRHKVTSNYQKSRASSNYCLMIVCQVRPAGKYIELFAKSTEG